jgi:hypothetical protein
MPGSAERVARRDKRIDSFAKSEQKLIQQMARKAE